jgi:hypothetical protein
MSMRCRAVARSSGRIIWEPTTSRMLAFSRRCSWPAWFAPEHLATREQESTGRSSPERNPLNEAQSLQERR